VILGETTGLDGGANFKASAAVILGETTGLDGGANFKASATVILGEATGLDGGANFEASAAVILGETTGLDGGANFEASAAVILGEATGLDRALHLQAGRRRGLHDRHLPDSLVEKTFRERLTELQRPCHIDRDRSDRIFPGFRDAGGGGGCNYETSGI
jgi:hypothetical protein